MPTKRFKIIEKLIYTLSETHLNGLKLEHLIQYMRGTFDQMAKFAPVLDKDSKQAKTAYFEAKKPINDYIKKQESSVIAIKEGLNMQRLDAIDEDDD